MATFKSAQSAGFTGSFQDWVSAGRPSGTATTAETKLTPERARQKEEAARSLGVRAAKTSRTEAERKQLQAARTTEQKEQIRQQQQSTQQRQSLAQEAEEQRQQAETRVGRETGTVGGQFVAGREFIDQRQRQLAQQEAAVPEAPTFEPPEGATQLEMAQAESAYNKQLADFYQTQAAAGREELATVSAQVSDFGDQLRFNQEQIDRLVNNLNTQNTGLGDTVRNTLDQIAASGGQVDLNEGTLRMIESMAATTPPDQLPQQINNLVTNTPAVNQNQPMVTDDLRMGMITPAQQYGSLSQSGATASQIITQRPDLAEYVQPDGTVINSEAGVGLIRTAGGEAYQTPSGLMIPRNSSTGFADYNALSPDQMANMSYIDVLGIEMATKQSSADLKAFYTGQMLNHQYQKNRRDTALYADEINSFYNNETNRLNMNKISQLQEVDLERQRQQLSFDTSMRSLNDANARQNNRMKAMLDAYGLEGSTASMHIMSSMDLKFQQEASTLRRGYDINLASLANSTSLVKMNYANRLVEINQNKSIALDKLRNQFIDTENQIEQSVLLNRIDKITNKQNAYSEYVKEIKNVGDRAQEQAQKEAAQAQQMIWEREKFYSQQSGMLIEIGEDGAVNPMRDAQGNTIATFQANKFYQTMALDRKKVTTNEFGEPVIIDVLTGQSSPIGQINPNNNFPYNGVQAEGNYTISFSGQTVAPGQKYRGQGECVGACRSILPDLPTGLDNIIDKRRTYSGIRNFADMRPGDGIFFNGGDIVTSRFSGTTGKTGHAAVIESIDYENQTVRVVDANYNGDNRWGVREFHFSQIDRDPSNDNLGIFRSANPQIPRLDGVITTGEQPTRNYTKAQELLMDSIDLKKVTKDQRAQLRRQGLTEDDLFGYRSSGKLSEDKISEITSIISKIRDLQQLEGLSGAVGAGFQKILPFVSADEGFIGGTDAADFKAKFDAFRDELALPSLEKLKGAMSDKDIQFIRNSVTSLSLDMSEETFRKELRRLDNKYNEILSRGGSDPVKREPIEIPKRATRRTIKKMFEKQGIEFTDEDVEWAYQQSK